MQVIDLSVNMRNCGGLPTTNQMLVVAKDLQTQYEKALDSASISRELRPHFRKWLRFYPDFAASTDMRPEADKFVAHFHQA